MLGRVEMDLRGAHVGTWYLVQQVAGHTEGRPVQGQPIDLADIPVQPAAHLGQDRETGIRGFVQDAGVGGDIKTQHPAVDQGAGGNRVDFLSREHDGFSKGIAGCNEVDDLFMTVGRIAGQFHLPVQQHVETVRRLLLLEQNAAFLQVEGTGVIEYPAELFVVEVGKQRATLNVGQCFSVISG